MELNNDIIWLVAGVAMLVSEFLLISGVGFIFAGLGALLVGAIMSFGGLDSLTWQWVVFLASTIILAILLWKPMKNLGMNQKGQGFNDIVGQKAVLTADLSPSKSGKAKWSGTVMNAKLDDGVIGHFKEGHELEIVRVEGNVLVLR